jgi:DNA-binding beta-propeller fold protein YncE
MSTRARLSLPALLAIMLAAALGQAPVAAASTARMLPSTRSPLATARAPAHLARGAAGFPAVRGQTRTSLLPMPARAAGLRDWVAAGNDDSALGGDPGPSRWSHHRFGSFGSALVGSAPAGKGPSVVALDTATHTIYVANGNNANGPNAGGDTVSVIDARHCSAQDVSRCQGPWPTITVGHLPAGIAVDQKTDTVYVANNGDNTVSVFNGATCNAVDTSGCGQNPATVPVGPGPLALFNDPANHTVYIANCGSSCGIGGPASTIVSMLDTATCNATDLQGCPATPPPTADVGAAPVNVDVAQASRTAYVTTIGAHKAQNGWAVFNASTCNAAVQSGCGAIGRIIGDPSGPNAGVIDPANDTLYTANFDTTMSAFDLRHCNASDLAGCASDKPGTVTVAPPADAGFAVALWLVADAPLHTVYVVNQKDDTLSAVNTNVCNGSHLAACARLRPPTIHSGEDPESVALNPQTQTLYTANQVTSDVSVIDAARCNATITRGCRRPPPAVALPGAGGSAADPAAGTVYVTTGPHTVSMINSRICNASRLTGCARRPTRARVGTGPNSVAVNPRTHTVYVASAAGTTGTVTVLNDQTCNAANTTGCTNAHTLRVPGGNAAAIAVNPATDTIYVATAPPGGPAPPATPSTVSVFNGATCNAATSAGCGQVPHTATVGFDASALAVNPATDTIYVANFSQKHAPFAGNTVSVIDGITCNATDTSGCANTPQTITVGPAFTTPAGVAIDQAADTIYVANLENGEGNGTVSVINGAICNATTTTGCGHTPPTVTVGFGPTAVAFDPANQAVAVTNIEDTSVSVIHAATCNATITAGCHRAQPKSPAGRGPATLAIEPAVRTMYISNGDNTVSIIPATR